MSKLVTIHNREGKVIGNVDEHTSLAHMRAECPNFFHSPTAIQSKTKTPGMLG